MDVVRRASVVIKQNGTPTITHPLDGRYGAMDPRELMAAVRVLAGAMDLSDVDYVLGFPEGGSVPAFAFAHHVGRPLILSTRLEFSLAGVPPIAFREPHSSVGKSHYIHGLAPGDRVVIMEDEVTSGGTLVSVTRALRAAGVHISQVGALLVVDDPRTWQAVANEKLTLHVVYRLPAGFSRRPEVTPGPSAGDSTG
jgi:adenine/guanine phosphoribosyltransferase-like PRPP-binding protein